MSIKWLRKTALIIAVLFILMSLAAYLIDPFFIYRHRDNGAYWLQPDYTSMGLVMNADYDTLLIGSSMTQNFNAEKFGEAVDGDVLKVNSGGLSVSELCSYVDLAQETGKTEKYYICLDLHLFASAKEDDTDRFRDELTDGFMLNDFGYLLGYETWMRFIPIDIGLMLLKTAGVEYPDSLMQKTDVDRAGEWAGDFSYGSEIVLNGYLSGSNRISEIDKEGLYGRMTDRVDDLLEAVGQGEDAEYTFFFAPYSALYWYDAGECGYYETFMEIKEYMVGRLLELDFEIIDFQCEEYIADLDNYRDISHYGPGITEKMTEVFAGDSNRVSSAEECSSYIDRQNEIVYAFSEEYRDLLESAKE